jgi:predicted RNase H-like HicB family nuclease
MVRYVVSLEIGEDNWCMAHVPELPGCFAKAPSQEEVLRALRAEIANYLSWLREIGEELPPEGEPIELEVAETFQIPGKVADGHTQAVFAYDLKPLTKKELERYLRLLEHSRRKLIALLQSLEREFGGYENLFNVLRWRPDEDSKSILEHIHHIFTAEAWYLARLAQEPAKDWAHYELLRQLTIDRLRRLTTEERKQKTVHPPNDETWTARKVMRRALWHERYHIRQIEEVVKRYKQKILTRG